MIVENKSALVTGGGRGIGAAISRVLAASGYHVYINYLKSRAAAEVLARETGGTAIHADVSDAGQVREMLLQAGPLDALVINAGVGHTGLFTDMTGADIRRVLDVNLVSAINCLEAALPGMISRKSGRIVLISSMWGVTGASCEAVYAASKAALNALGVSLARELGPSGIAVNCVAPGVIGTEMNRHLSPAELGALADATPLGRLGTPEDVAELVGFLLSDRAGFITGQVIRADGGFIG